MKQISSILKGKTLKKNMKCLSDRERETFDSFLHCLDDSQIVYRYIGNAILKNEFNTDTTNVGVLSNHIFLFGDKGRTFYKGKTTSSNLNFKDVEDKVFENIYDKLCKIFINTSSLCEKTGNAISESRSFSKVNLYFSQTPKEKWIEHIKQLTDEERVIVKNYYISFLHTVGKSATGNESYYLSTSTDYDFCNKWREEHMEKKENGIILIGWIGKQDFVKTWCKKNQDIIRNYGLPIIDAPLYAKQKEITLLCGMLPHYIIGYVHDNSFEVNPYIFEADMVKVQKEGLPVNQEDFHKNITQTNLKAFYYMIGDLYIKI